MVKITGMLAKRVLNPIITSIGNTTSAKTAKIKEAGCPIPMGSTKEKSPETKFKNFGIPWVSIIPPKATRRNSNVIL